MESVKVMMGDPSVREFLALLDGNEAGQAGFRSLIGHIGQIEGQLFEAAKEAAALRREVAEMRERAGHPVRAALTEAAERLERGIADARKWLDAVKTAILAGVKKAVAAVRDAGISALNGAVHYFGVKDDLAGLQSCLDREVQALDKTIAKIETVSAEYHETGKHLRNIGRALRGKGTVQNAKPMGRIAKTVRAPVRGARAVLSGASKSAAAAIKRLDQLEKAARPSVLVTIRDSRRQKTEKATGMALERRKNREASL